MQYSIVITRCFIYNIDNKNNVLEMAVSDSSPAWNKSKYVELFADNLKKYLHCINKSVIIDSTIGANGPMAVYNGPAYIPNGLRLTAAAVPRAPLQLKDAVLS